MKLTHYDYSEEEKQSEAYALQITEIRNKIQEDVDDRLALVANTDFELDGGNPLAKINYEIFAPPKYCVDKRNKFEYRTAEELLVVYDAYCQILKEICSKYNYTPTLNSFCNFASISRYKFYTWADENNDRGNACCMIKQNLEEGLLQGLLSGRVKETSGIFIAKALFNLRDNSAPTVMINNIQTDKSVEEILEDFNKHIVKSNAEDI